MADWLEPLWNLFTPKGALQEQLQDGNPSTPMYSAFGRYAKTFKYKIMYPITTEPDKVTFFKNYANPIGLDSMEKTVQYNDQVNSPDPRVNQTAGKDPTDPTYDDKLSNMIISTNSNPSGILALIGMFFVALIIISKLRKWFTN